MVVNQNAALPRSARGKMLGPAAQVSVRRQKAANKSKARAARKNSAQSSLFSMGFRPSQLDQAERIAAHAEALRKEATPAPHPALRTAALAPAGLDNTRA